MMRSVAASLVAVLVALAASASAATLRGQIPPNHLLREYWLAGPGGRIVAYPANLTLSQSLSSQTLEYESFIKRDGSWSLELPDPAPGQTPEYESVVSEDGTTQSVALPLRPDTYLLKFRVRGLQFREFRVDVRPPKREGQAPLISVRAHNPLYPISAALYLSNPEPLPLIEAPSTVHTYFQSIQDFNALNYLWMTLKSPMILMAVGAWAAVSLLPKLTESLDPDSAPTASQPQALAANRLAAIQSGDWRLASPNAQPAGMGQAGTTGAQIGAGSQANKRK